MRLINNLQARILTNHAEATNHIDFAIKTRYKSMSIIACFIIVHQTSHHIQAASHTDPDTFQMECKPLSFVRPYVSALNTVGLDVIFQVHPQIDELRQEQG